MKRLGQVWMPFGRRKQIGLDAQLAKLINRGEELGRLGIAGRMAMDFSECAARRCRVRSVDNAGQQIGFPIGRIAADELHCKVAMFTAGKPQLRHRTGKNRSDIPQVILLVQIPPWIGKPLGRDIQLRQRSLDDK